MFEKVFIKACVNIVPTFFAVKTRILTVNGVSGCSHASEDGVCPGGAGVWFGQTPLRHCGCACQQVFFNLKEINFLFIIL